MDLNCRRDQFSYFLGFASKGSESFLNEAIRMHADRGYKTPSPSDAFQYCPFNDTLPQIIRSMHAFERARKIEITKNIYNIISEFMFLASDFEPPCCGDGRAFYEKTARGEIVLACDRCGAAYSLDTRPIRSDRRMRMTKPQFVEIFGEGTAKDWPYHRKLRTLLADSTF
jgi:hypothetical protein